MWEGAAFVENKTKEPKREEKLWKDILLGARLNARQTPDRVGKWPQGGGFGFVLFSFLNVLLLLRARAVGMDRLLSNVVVRGQLGTYYKYPT